MLMRVSLPVFVLPKVAAKPLLSWQAVRTSDGALKISLTNDGNAHIQISISVYQNLVARNLG